MMIRVIICAGAVLCVALLFHGRFFKTRFEFSEVIRQPSFEKCEHNLSPEINAAREFLKELLNSYYGTLQATVHPRFIKSFRLWESGKLSARVLLSSFAETVIYIYPSNKSEMIVDCTNLPGQMVFFYDLVNLKEPKYAIYDDLIKITVDKERAVQTWAETSTNLISPTNGAAYFTGPGAFGFVNPYKVFFFRKNGFMTFFQSSIRVDRNNSDVLHEEVYRTKEPHNFSFQVEGALIFSGERDLSGLGNIAKQIGAALAEIEIKDLIKSSEFFRESLAHKDLCGEAQEIVKKKDRAEKESDPFLYPLWEYLKDIEHLKQRAQGFGISTSYIDQLLIDKALEPNSGHFFGLYFSDQLHFSLLWCMLNSALIMVLALLMYQWPSAFSYLLTKFSIIGIVLAINGFVYIDQRPRHLDLGYLLVPGLLFISCILLVLVWNWAAGDKA